MSIIKHAVILAAGRGARMMPLTDKIPKPMAPFGDSTLIGNSINNLKKIIKNIHITVGYKKGLLSKYVIDKGVSSIINTENKGNSWWLFNSLLSEINEPILVLTCDNIVELDLNFIQSEYNKNSEPVCLVLPVKPVVGIDGDYIFHDQGVVTELSRTNISNMYCSGIQVLNPIKIRNIITECDNFNSVWEQLIILKQLYCSNIYPNKWISIDTVDQLLKASSSSFSLEKNC